MTTEERTTHAKEISDKYVPRISPDNTEIMSEIKELPIQDIITIHSNAEYALNKGLLGMFAANPNIHDITTLSSDDKYIAAIKHVRQIIIERLKTADALWTITDRITKSPFIDDINHVWVFSEKELADECVDYYMQQYRTTFEVTEIKKDDIIKFFGQTAYMKGAECFRVDMGGYAGIKLKSEWIIEKPDFSNTPYINRPVMNPDYFRAVAKFKEEYHYRANYEGKKEKLHQFENDMIKAFHDARFLVPVKGMEQIKKNLEGKDENGEGVLTKGTKIFIPSLSKGERENVSLATPIFTDWEEFNKAYSQDEWGGWIWTAKDLLSAPDDVVCLNVGSLCFEMSKKMIQQMLDIYDKEFVQQPKPTFDEKVLKYKETDKDKLLAEIAQVIVGAYNGSYKPHLIPKEKEVAPPYYKWKHSSEGYSLVASETQDFEQSQVLTTDAYITDFIEHVFLVIAGNSSVKWEDVCKSSAVAHALEKYYESEVYDFDKINALPIIYVGDNDIVIYLRNERCFAKLNIVDGAIFKKKDDLAEVIGGISE